MIATENFEKVEVASQEELRLWLASNYGQEESVWLVTWKSNTPEKYLSTAEVLDALLSFGWVDGIRRKLDDARTMQLISQRRTQYWSKTYKDRVERLIAEGLMATPGYASIESGKKSGLWFFMDDVDALIVPNDLEVALSLNETAERYFAESPDAYKRNLLRWVKLAKTEPTRAKRIAQIVQASKNRERIPQM